MENRGKSKPTVGSSAGRSAAIGAGDKGDALRCLALHQRLCQFSPVCFLCVIGGFSSSSPHSVTYLAFWPPEHACLPLDESATLFAYVVMN